MFKKIFCKKQDDASKNVVSEKIASLKYGEELKLVMNNGDTRVVTVLNVRKDWMRVKELFHGVYDLPYKEIMFVYRNDKLYTSLDLKKWVIARVNQISA